MEVREVHLWMHLVAICGCSMWPLWMHWAAIGGCVRWPSADALGRRLQMR